jgi:uncharacterized membrane protein
MILGNKKGFRRYVKAAIAATVIFSALALASAVPAWPASEAPAASKPAALAGDDIAPSRKNKNDVGLRGHGFTASNGVFTTIDVPGATSFTIVFGINTAGDTVGGYVDAQGATHGFLRRGDAITTIDVPGAQGTFAFRANDAGQIVGAYGNEANVPVTQLPHGFLLDLATGVFTTIAVPGAVETRPFGINNAGQIVGEYVDAARRSHGFMLDPQNGNTVTTIDAPGGTSTIATDIDDAGRIVGIASGASVRGFLRDPQGAFTPIDAPAAPPPPGRPELPGTQLFGINNRGQMTGIVFDSEGIRSFVLDNGAFTTIDAPDAVGSTLAHDISDDGRVAGAFDVEAHGYVRDRQGNFTTIDHPDAVTETVLTGSNRRGQIVGAILDASLTFRGFLFDKGRFIPIEVPGALGSAPNRINDRGQIVGSYSTLTNKNHAFPARGYLWDRGEVTLIDVPGAQHTSPNDIDNQGQIVGYYVDTEGIGHGFLRDHSGTFTTIDIPGAIVTAIRGINERGQMIGNYDDAAGVGHGFLWDGGTVTTIDAPDATVFTSLIAINNDGVIVGASDGSRSFVLENGTFTTLHAPGAFQLSLPFDIDDHGQIVGTYF